jgi:uncharacterized membrane protein
MGIVAENVALGHNFSEYFGFPFRALYLLLHILDHLSASCAEAIGHLVASLILNWVPLHHKKQSCVPAAALLHKLYLIEQINIMAFHRLTIVKYLLNFFLFTRTSDFLLNVLESKAVFKQEHEYGKL